MQVRVTYEVLSDEGIVLAGAVRSDAIPQIGDYETNVQRAFNALGRLRVDAHEAMEAQRAQILADEHGVEPPQQGRGRAPGRRR